MWKIVNQGHGVDVFVRGVKYYLAPSITVRTDNAELIEEARKAPYVLVTEDFSDFSLGKLRKLAFQRGIVKFGRFTKKKLLEKLSEVKIDECTRS